MKKSHIFLYFSFCFILGVTIRSLIYFDLFYVFIFLLVCLIFSIIFWPSNFRVVPRIVPRSSAIKTFLFKKSSGDNTYLFKKNCTIIFLGVFFLFLGFLRYEISEPRTDSGHIALYNGQRAEFIGQIVSEPDIREKHVKLTLNNLELVRRSDKGSLVSEGGEAQGKILINYYKFTDLNYGDWVNVRCELQKPGVIESDDWRDFDYARYLSVKGIYSVCYEAEMVEKIDFVETHSYASLRQKIYSKVLGVKQKFKEIIDTNLSLPQSGLLNAMFLGYRRELQPELIDNFAKTGVSHLIAISGLHMTIIAGLLFYLFIMLGVPRQKSFYPAVLILCLYVCMIGFRASAVRALIMGAVLMYALKVGRLSKSINTLVLAGVVLLLINPKLLLFDIGFQLSFLAVLGILYFFPLFNKWLEFIPDKFKIRSMICLTLSAQVLTLPLIVYYFGRLSIISPISNLLILPILPVVMLAGICMALLGLIWSKFAFGIGIFLWIILSYIIKIVEILSQIPYGFIEMSS